MNAARELVGYFGRQIAGGLVRACAKALEQVAHRIDGDGPAPASTSPAQPEYDPLDDPEIDNQPMVVAGGRVVSEEASKLVERRKPPEAPKKPEPLEGSVEWRKKQRGGF